MSTHLGGLGSSGRRSYSSCLQMSPAFHRLPIRQISCLCRLLTSRGLKDVAIEYPDCPCLHCFDPMFRLPPRYRCHRYLQDSNCSSLLHPNFVHHDSVSPFHVHMPFRKTLVLLGGTLPEESPGSCERAVFKSLGPGLNKR